MSSLNPKHVYWVRFRKYISLTYQYTLRNVRALVLLGFSLAVVYTVGSSLIIQKRAHNIYLPDDPRLSQVGRSVKVGIVFGGGIQNNQPLPLLRDRLNTAKELLQNGTVEKLVLSGDNRFLEYNEPLAMYQFLVDNGVDAMKLQVDYAGRSTYETCERAKKIFNVHDAILITESTHLPRAIYLCERFGITAYGAISDGQSSDGLKVGQRWREILARNKAVFNVYFIGEETVLGDPIELKL